MRLVFGAKAVQNYNHFLNYQNFLPLFLKKFFSPQTVALSFHGIREVYNFTERELTAETVNVKGALSCSPKTAMPILLPYVRGKATGRRAQLGNHEVLATEREPEGQAQRSNAGAKRLRSVSAGTVVPLRGTLALTAFSPGLAHLCAETRGFVRWFIFDEQLAPASSSPKLGEVPVRAEECVGLSGYSPVAVWTHSLGLRPLLLQLRGRAALPIKKRCGRVSRRSHNSLLLFIVWLYAQGSLIISPFW